MRVLPAVFLSVAVCATCFGHDTWLSPTAYSAEPNSTVSFHLTSGMQFPALDSAVKPERVAIAGARINGEETKLPDFKAAEHSAELERTFARGGVATLWVQLKPKEIELKDDDVAHYLEEARAPDEVQRAWAAQKGREKWKELYTKCAKTCLRIGKPDDDEPWAQPVGMALELIPLANPTTLRTGAAAKFRLLRNGEPLANAAVALHTDGDADPRYETTGADGVVTFPLANPGPTMLATVFLRPPAPGRQWESEFSTLTFDVQRE